MFRLIPTDNKRRRDALAAALKLKQAVKALRALLAMGQSGAAATKIGSSSESGDGAAAVADVTALTAAAVETPSDGDGGDATASSPSEGSSSSSSAAAKAERMREKRLHGAHLVLKEVTQALLEVTFPLEEEVAKRFDDNAAFSACTRRCVDQRRCAAVCKHCLAPLLFSSSYPPPPAHAYTSVSTMRYGGPRSFWRCLSAKVSRLPSKVLTTAIRVTFPQR